MKEIIFNDGRNIEVQAVTVSDGALYIRMILQTWDQLKALFKDEFATARLTEKENGKEVNVYENYKTLSYIKEEAGGIWEVELLQTEAGYQTRMAAVEEAVKENKDSMQMAIAELTLAIASLFSNEGGETNV